MSAPKAAKKPQDRLMKAAATNDVISVTHNGETYTIAAEAFDDVETFELLGRMQIADNEESLLLMPLILRRSLGDKQWQTFLRTNRKDGRVGTAAMVEIFELIDTAAGNRQASPGS